MYVVYKLGVRSELGENHSRKVEENAVMSHSTRPQLKLEGNIKENFKNFQIRFHDYCIHAEYRDVSKQPTCSPVTFSTIFTFGVDLTIHYTYETIHLQSQYTSYNGRVGRQDIYQMLHHDYAKYPKHSMN